MFDGSDWIFPQFHARSAVFMVAVHLMFSYLVELLV